MKKGRLADIHLILVGKTREPFIQAGMAFYRQRLQPFVRLVVTTVREERQPQNLTAPQVKSREGERLRAAVPPRTYVVALDPGGRETTSEGFAAWLAARLSEGRGLAFLVGGRLGLDEATLAAAHERLALSRLTLTHELARLVLLEQLYRAQTILAGHPYHV